MAKVSIEDIKACIGVTGTEYDGQIQCEIDCTLSCIEGVYGCKLCLEEGETYTEHIAWEDVCIDKCGAMSVLLCSFNVKEIVSINGKPYTGVNGVDYMIKKPNNRKLVMCGGLCPNKFGCVTIEYKGGFDEIPGDLFNIIKSSAEAAVGAECGKEVSSYTIGDKKVSYCCGADSQFSLSAKCLAAAFKKYKKPFIYGSQGSTGGRKTPGFKTTACCSITKW